MAITEKILIISGSPKKTNGTSLRIADYIFKRITAYGINAEIQSVNSVIESESSKEKFINSIISSTAIIFICPVYVDSLPFVATKAIEEIYKLGKSRLAGKRMLSIVHCGFRRVDPNFISTSILKIFADKLEMKWLGSFMIPGGNELINEKKSKFISWITQNIWKALDIISDDISKNKETPEKVFDLAQKLVLPRCLFLMVDNYIWWSTCIKKSGLGKRIYDAPYQN